MCVINTFIQPANASLFLYEGNQKSINVNHFSSRYKSILCCTNTFFLLKSSVYRTVNLKYHNIYIHAVTLFNNDKDICRAWNISNEK